MNHKLRKLLWRWVYGVPLAALIALPGAPALANHSITAQLTGDEQVPAVQTEMSGNVEVEFDKDNNTIRVDLEVEDGTDITAAHLHCGAIGENGPVVVSLFEDQDGISGHLMRTIQGGAGLIADNTCNPKISTIDDLMNAANEGRIYANVHTKDHPGGEIRGQLPGHEIDEDTGNDNDGNNDDDQDTSPITTFVHMIIQRIFNRVSLSTNF